MEKFKLGAKRPLIISGPCSAETEEQTLQTCRQLAAEGVVDVLRAGIWKPRTRPGTFEGVGLPGLAWLAKAKRETGLPIATEVASAKHVESALEFGVDLLWIGARTTVNPFLVQEIAEACAGNDVQVLIKNPMHPEVALWAGAVARFVKAGTPEENIGLLHRGFSVGGANHLRNNPMWHLALEMQSLCPNMMMLCDPSHICGNREYLQEIAQKSADLNYDGLMVESHICPAEAWSDASQQLEPKALGEMIRSLNWRSTISDDPDYLKALARYREQIDQIDSELFELLSERMRTAEKIGQIKKANNVAILQSNRWEDICRRMLSMTRGMGLSEEFVRTVLEAIHLESISRQNEIMNSKE